MPRRGLTGEKLVALFVLGVALFTPPWLGIFNYPRQVLGIPLLYLYLFAAWAVLIAITALIVERSGGDSEFEESVDTPPAREE